MKLLIATGNSHKLREIRAILAEPGLEIVSPREWPHPLPPIEEDGDTFEANAIKKAMLTALAAGLWVLADDSGLEVEALDNAPGVRSARYAGEPSDDANNNALLLKNLAPAPNRRARFRCAIALASPSGRCQVVDGTCPGSLLADPRGARGFGYDPLFVPDGDTRTFAEMPDAEKNAISHRAKALQKARETWGPLLASEASDWPRR
ncbi:MAG: RdgB/HAM1 family non-canonical purine NTP pyrophosphatase [Kiritimatiellia bacterium]